MTPHPIWWYVALAWLVGLVMIGSLLLALWEWGKEDRPGAIDALLFALTALAVIALACDAHADARFVRDARGRVTIMTQPHMFSLVGTRVAPGDTGVALYGGRQWWYTILKSDSTYRLLWPKENVSPAKVYIPSGVTAATPVTLGYTIPLYQAAPGDCDPAATPILAHCDSVRIIAWRRMPDPFDATAWRNAQLAGWEVPYTVRTKFVGGLAGHDTLRVPLLPVGTTVAVQARNERGYLPCYSNLCRGANE